MKTGAKAALMLAGAATLAASAPAQARGGHYGHNRHDGIDAGDIIAGALIIGGIAAIAAAASDRDNRYGGNSYGRRHDNYGGDDGYFRDGYGSRRAVEQCINAARREASRYGWARVTDVTRIDRVRGGYKVRGRLVVEDRGYQGRRGGFDRGYSYDRYSDGYDRGRFSCTTRYGGVDDVNVSGLNGGHYY
jgi:hypothetical protein